MQTVLTAKQNSIDKKKRNNLEVGPVFCFIDQETQEEIMLGGPTPL